MIKDMFEGYVGARRRFILQPVVTGVGGPQAAIPDVSLNSICPSKARIRYQLILRADASVGLLPEGEAFVLFRSRRRALLSYAG